MTSQRVLYVVVCGAGPASGVGTLIEAAQESGWTVHVLATPAGLSFIDAAQIESTTGNPVRSTYRNASEPRGATPKAGAIIVAPATFNTINKLAAGIADNYALGVLAECIGLGVPVVIVPFINTALARRAPLQGAIADLRAEGVHILFGRGQIEPHKPGKGGRHALSFPWSLALAEANRLANAHGQDGQ